MPCDDNSHERTTRREYLKYSGVIATSGLFAGCAASQNAGVDDTPTTEASTPTNTVTGATTSTAGDSYSVRMAPVGTVEFDSVPETAVLISNNVADHLVALGQQDRIITLGYPEEYYTGFYDELPGVEFETGDLTQLLGGSFSKELLYELDADVHHIDPVFRTQTNSLSQAAIDEVERNVAPFFNNWYSRAHGYQGDQPYRYYSLWELLDKFAQVYQVRQRSQALTRVRNKMVAEIQAELPPQKDRPLVALVTYSPTKDTFRRHKLNGPGWGKAHTRPLGANGAFEDMELADGSGSFSMEAMVETDPDVVIYNHEWVSPGGRSEKFLALSSHPIGKNITAAQNDRVYLGGTTTQGPIFNLFQIELTAKQIYPDIFGSPPEPGESVPESEQMFDRQHVADIINGDV
ncbi:ABC transporter substrate-binding protein [Haloarcula amylolytica]|nr:ABC transporter substrate-binding protein [Haloarcula amylolytica]